MRADPEKARRWEQTVSEQEASGLKAAAFCRDRGVAPALFYPWRRYPIGIGVNPRLLIALKKG
jgi:hypothetical protein